MLSFQFLLLVQSALPTSNSIVLTIVCKRRCEATEIRRLSLKVRSLERVIQNLKNDRTSSARSPSRDISPMVSVNNFFAVYFSQYNPNV